MTEDEIDEIEARCNSSSPAPWKSFVEGRDHTSGSSFIRTGPENLAGRDIELSGATISDQDFIANSRQDVPRLIAEIRRLQTLVSR
jgi:hypothetical protein